MSAPRLRTNGSLLASSRPIASEAVRPSFPASASNPATIRCNSSSAPPARCRYCCAYSGACEPTRPAAMAIAMANLRASMRAVPFRGSPLGYGRGGQSSPARRWRLAQASRGRLCKGASAMQRPASPDYRLGSLYSLITAFLLATQEPFSFLAAQRLTTLQFVCLTQIALLISIPLVTLPRGALRDFVRL